MALVASQAGDEWTVTGVTGNPEISAPLGRYHANIGPHWIGFDDRFAEPVIVRAYYDPVADPKAAAAQRLRPIKYIGYMQFMQLNFAARPIPPEVYGGRLAERQPYVFGPDHRFIDFMGPKDAAIRKITSPFYAFNGMLTGAYDQDSDFFIHPRANGSLCSAQRGGPDQSVVASLVGEIAPSLVTPKDIDDYVRDEPPLVTYDVPAADLAHSEPYRIALDRLKTMPLPNETGPPPLQGLDESGVTGTVIGRYVLLTLPDRDELGATLCVSSSSATEVRVHLLSAYDTAEIYADAAREALWRIKEYDLESGTEPMEIDSEAEEEDTDHRRHRGRRGLLSRPYDIDPDDFILELKYWTVAVAYRERWTRSTPTRQILSGVTWSALFQFDENTGLMTLSAIRKPQEAKSFELQKALRAYRATLESPETKRKPIDTSNFTMAAMRRDKFRAGTPLRFVDAGGNNLPT